MTSNKEKIFAYIEENEQSSVVELDRVLDIERVMIHRHLKALLEEGRIEKIGKSPKVFYIVKKGISGKILSFDKDSMSQEEQESIQDNFLFITPSGERQKGIEGFVRWCRDRHYDAYKKAIEYSAIYQKYESFRKYGLIDGMEKFRQTFGKDCAVDSVYYVDVYAWEVFGKTKLGQLLLYAKQSQNKDMIREIVSMIRPLIDRLLEKHAVSAIGYIPPTIKRSVQFIEELKKELNLSYPEIRLEKISGEVAVPQKSLSQLKDRIENAQSSIFVTEKKKYETILLIDDAVGSGATFQEVALKIKKRSLAKKVICFAVTGSAKGFDVISEV